MSEKAVVSREKRERGASLVEVLIALMIMMFLMLGVLQMFSLAYLQNLGSAARTEMTYRAQQFAETVRYLNVLGKRAPAVTVSGTGMTFPITSGTSGTSVTVDPTTASYWGPTGAAVYSTTSLTNSRYTISYQMDDGDNPPAGIPITAGCWTMTVTVTPRSTGTAARYQGMAIRKKPILYVAQIPK